MLRISCIAVTWVFTFATSAAAADDATAVLDKAITAHGGEAKIAKNPAVYWKSKGTIYLGGMEIPFTAEHWRQSLDRARTAIEADIQGQKISILQVVRGDKAWNSFNGVIMELE